MFDLLTERYEDLFEESPEALRDASRDEDGELVFEETGDDLIDKWERELNMGITPDLHEGLSKESLQELDAEKKKMTRAKQIASVVAGDHDIIEQLMGSTGKGPGGISREDAAYLRDNSLGNDRPAGVDRRSNLKRGR